jgi:dTDP-4-amino-4,6-dideoxygalactose transaminase
MTASTRVPLLDLRRNTALDAELEGAFRRVLQSGHYILGPEVEAFERECALYIGAKHAIAVSSGTDALLVALMALGVGPGDEVVCPTHTFFATGGVVWRLGARPRFVDSEPTCFNLDPTKLEAAITSKTKAIVPVHLFGQCADMTAISDIARRRGIPIVEDAAQALGARHGAKQAGTFGIMGCFSFFPSKNLGALGDAGLVTTDDDVVAERLRVLRSHGGKPKYYHAVVGGNFRIDALQAALLRVKLPHLDAASEQRARNAQYYVTELTRRGVGRVNGSSGCGGRCAVAPVGAETAPLLLPSTCQTRHLFNQFVIRIPGAGARDALRQRLSERGVGTEIYYPVPLHLQECFASLGHHKGDFPVAESLASESLALPIFPELTKAEQDHVVLALTEAVAGSSTGRTG